MFQKDFIVLNYPTKVQQKNPQKKFKIRNENETKGK